MLAADFNLGDIQVRAQTDAGADNWAYNVDSQYLLKISFKAESVPGSWRDTRTRIN